MAKQGKYTYNWPRPMVTVDAAVFNIDSNPPQLLLIRRGNEPFKGQWAFPGGFVEMDEHLETAVARELAEETSLTNIKLTQLHTFGNPRRDPRGRNITIVFIGTTTTANSKITPGDDAAEAAWFPIDELPEMSFDHDKVATVAIERLKQIS